MIGMLRFVLASLVVANHVYLPTANQVGAHAVAGFYIISGFLMTKVLNEVYGYSPRGLGRFLVNRFLRIYPLYWIFLATSLVLLSFFPMTFGQTYSNMKMPQTAYDMVRNVTLWDLPRAPEIVIPPAWTLTVEVFFYLAMALVLSRHRFIVMAWVIVSLAIAVWLIASHAPYSQRYTPTYAASLFFSTGALLYFYPRIREALMIDRRWALAGLVVFCVAPLLARRAGFPPLGVGYYGPAILFLFIFVTLQRVRSGPWDRWLGDLAYPVFITHLLAAGIVRILFPIAVTPLSGVFLLSSYALSLLISAGAVRLQSRWLDPLRTEIRAGSPAAP